MSLAFLLTTLVVVATPGTGATYTISAGLSRGAGAGIVAAFGCTLGVVPHMVFMAVTFAVFSVYGVFAATMRRQVLGRPRVLAWMRRSFAAAYALLAGRLAFESR